MTSVFEVIFAVAPVSLRLMGLSELVCSAGLVGALRVDVIHAPTASMISRSHQVRSTVRN